MFRSWSTKDVTIFIEKNPTYNNYKTIGDGKTMYLNFDILNEGLLMGLWGATVNLNNSELVKAIVPVPKYNRAMQLRDNRIASLKLKQRIG
jgi:hypothetical protein